jgi:aspartyl-tRNA(Asn)/glutamyl-tRNA(Gln) amidotransferase subunit A
MSAALPDLLAREQSELFQKGEVSAVEIVEATLARIESLEGRKPSSEPYNQDPTDLEKLHAFITITAERALAQANDLDQRRSQGDHLGPLSGATLAVKDIFCVKDTPSTAGSAILESFISPYTATPVAQLEAAGAIVIGKANMDEFAFGSSSESSAFLPPPGNPWNPAHVPGGSSGGSTAAVAAGEAALSIGTDTAGSIRQPAAFCGVVGMKPTYGRVSRYGLIAFASSLDCPGPIARDVEDIAIMLEAMAGEDVRDATAAALPVPSFKNVLNDGIKGMRIGLSPDYFKLKYPDPDTGELREQAITAEIEQKVRMAAEVLEEQGAVIVEDVPMPNTHYGIPAYFVISRVEAASNLHRYDGVKYGHRSAQSVDDLRLLYRKTRGEGFGPQPKLRILMGMYVSAEQYEKGYYQQALRVRTLIRQDFERVFDPGGDYRLDALLTATTPTTAFKIGQIYGDSVLMQYADLLTVSANHAGIPAISLPTGFDPSGLPIGIQLMGADFQEATLLKIGRAFEVGTAGAEWRNMKPDVLNMKGNNS